LGLTGKRDALALQLQGNHLRQLVALIVADHGRFVSAVE
jgi:hypothetical protein